MEKIKLTVEQSKAIELFLKESKEDKEYLLDLHARSQKWGHPDYKAMNELSQFNLAKALLIGYEVEETYKVGDWKKYKHDFRKAWVYGFVSHVSIRAVDLDTGEGVHIISMDRLESCTPEEIKEEQERRVWKSIGREVGEFRIGDAYKNLNGLTHTVDESERIRIAESLYEKGKLKGFYPAESFIPFGGDSDGKE